MATELKVSAFKNPSKSGIDRLDSPVEKIKKVIWISNLQKIWANDLLTEQVIVVN